jgi:flagellar protein FliS
MPWQPEKAYLEAEVLTATPVRLVEILYDLAINSILSARQCCCTGDILGRGRFVSKAVEVLLELINGLDFQAGGELARNYGRLYDYCQRRLLQAHVEQSETMLQEVQSLLGEIREAWQVVVAEHSPKCPSDEEISAENLNLNSSEPRFSCVG